MNFTIITQCFIIVISEYMRTYRPKYFNLFSVYTRCINSTVFHMGFVA